MMIIIVITFTYWNRFTTLLKLINKHKKQKHKTTLDDDEREIFCKTFFRVLSYTTVSQFFSYLNVSFTYN